MLNGICHPIKRDIPLDRLRIVEDLSSRMMTERDIYKHKHSRAARFQLNSKNSDKFKDRPTNYEFLDELMEEIPGKDNYEGSDFKINFYCRMPYERYFISPLLPRNYPRVCFCKALVNFY